MMYQTVYKILPENNCKLQPQIPMDIGSKSQNRL